MLRRSVDILLIILFSYLAATIGSDLIVDRNTESVLELKIETDHEGVWQLFWGSDEQYTQVNSEIRLIRRPGIHTLTFPLVDQKIRFLRLDPSDGNKEIKDTFTIHEILLSNGFGTIYEKTNTEDIVPLNSSITKLNSNQFAITGPDPQLKLDFANPLIKSNREKHTGVLWLLRVSIFLLSGMIIFLCIKFIDLQRWRDELSTVFLRSARLLPFLILGGLIASAYGFINGFPIIFSDTGMYIRSGIEWFVPENRPVMFGVFLMLTSLRYCLWLTVIVQGMLVTYCCYLLLQTTVRNNGHLKKLTLLLMLILSLFTSLSWFSAQLAPDILCAIAPLALLVLFLDKSRYVSRKLTLIAIFLVCNLSHTSSLLISLGLSGFILVGTLFWRKHQELRKAILLCVLSTLSFPLLMTINYSISGKFTTGENSYIFTSAKLANLGLLQKYLRENPKGKDYQLATMVDDIKEKSNHFIWNKESVIHKLPRKQLKAELTEINKDILTDVSNLSYFLWKGVQHTCELFIHGTQYSLHSYKGKYVHDVIKKHYPHTEQRFLNSMQQRWVVSDKLNLTSNAILLWISYIGVPFVLFFYRKRIPVSVSFTGICLFFILVVNDFICATLSTAASRYHARLSWIVVVALFCLIAKLWESHSQNRPRSE